MVSIITINYNGYKDTCEFVDSIVTHETYPFEIIIVDNASRNEEGSRLQERYPNCTIVCCPENLGFAGGNNEGYKYAKGMYILFMNNDTIVEIPFLQPLVDRIDSSPCIGAVSPKIRYTHHPEYIQYAGFTVMTPIVLRNHLIGVNEKDMGQYDTATETAFAHGACVLTSRKVLDSAGLMSDVYFLFYEELDWTMQLKRCGYSVWYEPASIIYHKESMTIQKGSPLRLFYMTRSRFYFARRNYSGKYKWLSCLYQAGIVLPRNMLLYASKGQWKMLNASWKGAVHGLKDQINQ